MLYRRPTSMLLLLLIITLGCVIPGLPTAGDSAPVDEAARLETMVAGTVAAAMANTAQAAPTAAPPEATEPPLATPETSTTTELAAQNDGTILFTDTPAGYQMNVSPGWLPVRPGQPEYSEAFSLPAAADPAVQQALTGIATHDPNAFRLFIFDVQDGHLINRVVTNINLVWEPEGSLSLDDQTDIQEIAAALPASVPGLTVTESLVAATLNGIPVGVILSEIPSKNFDEADVMLFQKQVFLNLPAGTLAITFTTEGNFKDATLHFFDSMVDTLKINNGP